MSIQDELVVAFKQAWHEADERGEKGHRVQSGIHAVLTKIEGRADYNAGLSRAAEIVRGEARAPRKHGEPKMSIQEHDIIVNAALAKAAAAIEAERGA